MRALIGAILLGGGYVRNLRSLFTQILVFGVFNEADDLEGGIGTADVSVLFKSDADGIRAIQDFLDEGFVHDGNFGRGGRIVLVKIAAGDEGSLQRLEIIRRDTAEIGQGFDSRGEDEDVLIPTAAADGDDAGVGGGINARDGTNAVEQFALEREAALDGDVEARQIDVGDEKTLLAK